MGIYSDILEEDERFSPLSLNTKKKSFGDKFGENWMQSGERITDSFGDLAKATRETQTDTTRTPVQKFKDLSITAGNTGATAGFSALDMIFGSPISGVMPEPTEGGQPNAVFKTIDDVMKYGGEKYAEGLQQMTTRDLSEGEMERAKFTGGEGLVEGLAFGAVKAVVKTPKLKVGGVEISSDLSKELRAEMRKSMSNERFTLQKTSNTLENKMKLFNETTSSYMDGKITRAKYVRDMKSLGLKGDQTKRWESKIRKDLSKTISDKFIEQGKKSTGLGMKFGAFSLGKKDTSKFIEDTTKLLEEKRFQVEGLGDSIEARENIIVKNSEDLSKGKLTREQYKINLKENGIDPEVWINRIDEIRENKSIQSKALSDVFYKNTRTKKSRIYNKIAKELDDAGYKGESNTGVADKEIIDTLRRRGDIESSEIDNFLLDVDSSRRALYDVDTQSMHRLLELQQQKSSAGGMSKADVEIEKSENIVHLTNKGYLKEKLNSKTKQYEYSLTAKGETLFRDIDPELLYQTTNKTKSVFKDDLINNGIAHMPSKEIDNAKKKFNQGISLNKADVLKIQSDIFSDDILRRIEELDIKRNLGDASDADMSELFENIQIISNKYGLNLEDVNAGNIGDVINSLNKAKSENFITVSAIANPSKSINLKKSLGFNNRTIDRLFRKVEQLPKGDLSKKINQLKQQLVKDKADAKARYGDDVITLRAMLKNLAKENKKAILELKAKHEGLRSVQRQILDDIKNLPKTEPKFKGINIDAIYKKVRGNKTFDQIIDSDKALIKTIDRIEKEIGLEYVKILEKKIIKKLRLRKNSSGRTIDGNDIYVQDAVLLKHYEKLVIEGKLFKTYEI